MTDPQSDEYVPGAGSMGQTAIERPSQVDPDVEPRPPVPNSYKRGWSRNVPEDVAIQNTLKEVARLYPDQVVLGDPEIIENEGHKKKQEYLVRVLTVPA